MAIIHVTAIENFAISPVTRRSVPPLFPVTSIIVYATSIDIPVIANPIIVTGFRGALKCDLNNSLGPSTYYFNNKNPNVEDGTSTTPASAKFSYRFPPHSTDENMSP